MNMTEEERRKKIMEAIIWVNDRMCYGRYHPLKRNPLQIDECFRAGEMAIEALNKELKLPDAQPEQDTISHAKLNYTVGFAEGYEQGQKEALPPEQPTIVYCKDCVHCKHTDEYEHWCEGRGFPYQLVVLQGYCEKGEMKHDQECY